jgi:hypothetical protein
MPDVLYCLRMVILTETCRNRKKNKNKGKLVKNCCVDGICSDPNSLQRYVPKLSFPLLGFFFEYSED